MLLLAAQGFMVQHHAYALLSLGHPFLRHALGAAVLLLCITIVQMIDGIILHASLRVADETSTAGAASGLI